MAHLIGADFARNLLQDRLGGECLNHLIERLRCRLSMRRADISRARVGARRFTD